MAAPEIECGLCCPRLVAARQGSFDPSWNTCDPCSRKLKFTIETGKPDPAWELPKEKGGLTDEGFEVVHGLLASKNTQVRMRLVTHAEPKDFLEFECPICDRKTRTPLMGKLIREGRDQVLMEVAFTHGNVLAYGCVVCGGKVHYDTTTQRAWVPTAKEVDLPQAAQKSMEVLGEHAGPRRAKDEFRELRDE